MGGERLEQELRDYFKAEVNKAEPSPEWWNNAVSRVSNQKQQSRKEKPSFWNLRPSLIAVPLSIFLFIVLVGSLIPLMGGMAQPPPRPPAVVTDGSSGAFIFWYETPYNYSTGLYANHIDANGNYLWGEKGKHIAIGKISPPEAISDGDGGAIVAWGDRNSLYVKRLDSNGDSVRTWEEANPALSLLGMTGDGSGGAILLWQEDRSEQVYAQRISDEGLSLWGVSGTSVGQIQYAYFGMPIVSDGSGGAVIIWEDPGRKGVYAQRVGQNGELLWTADGVPLTSLTDETERPQLISDSNGEYIIAWSEHSFIEGFRETVYVQKLDAQGNRLWGEQGIMVHDSTEMQSDPHLTADGSGGCVVAWCETRYISGEQSNIFAQRIDSAGEIIWEEGGVPVSDTVQDLPSLDLGLVYITGDGAGGSTVIWAADKYTGGHHETHIYAQRLSPNGQRVWADAAVEIYKHPIFKAIGYSNITSDGSGGFIISSRVSEGRSVSHTDSVYAQRIDSEGNHVWGECGLEVQMKHSSPLLPIIAFVVVLITILILLGVFRGSRLARIFTAIGPVLFGIAALFSNLLLTSLFSYSYQWAYIFDTPLNLTAVAVVPVVGLTIVAVGIWKRTVTKWVMIPVIVFSTLVAAISGLIIYVS